MLWVKSDLSVGRRKYIFFKLPRTDFKETVSSVVFVIHMLHKVFCIWFYLLKIFFIGFIAGYNADLESSNPVG